MVLTMSISLYHRLQAASSGEKISRKDEGYLFAAVLRLSGSGLCLFMAALACVFSGLAQLQQLCRGVYAWASYWKRNLRSPLPAENADESGFVFCSIQYMVFHSWVWGNS